MTKTSLIESIYYALKGFFKEILFERNIKILMLFVLIILTGALIFNTTIIYFLILFIVCSLLILLETLNHFFEKMLDFLYPNYNKKVGQLKDYLAGMVLLALIVVLITSLIILSNPILTLLEILSKNLILTLFLILNFILLLIIDFVKYRKKNFKKNKFN
ncbi:MAG: diacylglycerol kinase family protein [Candidatus Pacearchaeota archaeon]